MLYSIAATDAANTVVEKVYKRTLLNIKRLLPSPAAELMVQMIETAISGTAINLNRRIKIMDSTSAL